MILRLVAIMLLACTGVLHPATAWAASALVGLYEPATSTWALKTSLTTGPADIVFTFGPAGAGWIPMMADWDGNGSSTPGLYDPATENWFLRNSITPGPPDIVIPSPFSPPNPGWKPMAGDFDGSLDADIVIHEFSHGLTWRKLTAPGPGVTDGDILDAFLSDPHVVPGDWTGLGKSGIALIDPVDSTWRQWNSLTPGVAGPADNLFTFPMPGGASPVAGDWDGDGVDSPGYFDSATGTWALRNANSSGAPDILFDFSFGGAVQPLVWVVPEPGSISLLLLGFAGYAAFLRSATLKKTHLKWTRRAKRRESRAGGLQKIL